MERISGWACDGCSLQATLKRIQGEVEKVKERLEVLNCVRMECKREIEGPVVAVVDGLKDGTPTKSTKEESPSTGTKKTKKKSPPDSTPEAKKESLMDSLTSTKKESPLDSITSTKTLDSTSTTITKTELVPDSNNNSSTKKKKKKTRRDPLKQLQKTEKEIRASLESLVSLTKDLSIVQRHAQCYPEDPLVVSIFGLHPNASF